MIFTQNDGTMIGDSSLFKINVTSIIPILKECNDTDYRKIGEISDTLNDYLNEIKKSE
jgi:hypothetical protein